MTLIATQKQKLGGLTADFLYDRLCRRGGGQRRRLGGSAGSFGARGGGIGREQEDAEQSGDHWISYK